MIKGPRTQLPPAIGGSRPGRAETAPVGYQQPTLGRLLRGSGWFAIGGGLLLTVDAIAHLFTDDTISPKELLGMPHELWHIPGVVGIMAALIGLMGIYLRQASRAGKLGHVGFVLLIVGVTLGAGYSTIFHALFLPSLERLEQGLFEEFIDAPVSVGQAVRGIAVQAIGLGLGAILFGAATIRARVLPRSGGWLMIAAALFAGSQEAIDGAQLISRLLFAATFLMLGSAIVRESVPATGNRGGPSMQ